MLTIERLVVKNGLQLVALKTADQRYLQWSGNPEDTLVSKTTEIQWSELRHAFVLEWVTAHPPHPSIHPPLPNRCPNFDTWDGAEMEAMLAGIDLAEMVTIRPYHCATAARMSPLFVGNADPGEATEWHLLATRSRLTAWRAVSGKEQILMRNYANIELHPTKWTRGLGDMRLIVARYNESLDWLVPYRSVARVYNKGETDAALQRYVARAAPFVDVVALPNVGREGHTYLHELMHNYDALPKRLVFTQGDPHPHNHTFRAALEYAHLLNSVQSLSWTYKPNMPVTEKMMQYLSVESPTGLRWLEFLMTMQMTSPMYSESAAFLQFMQTQMDKHRRVVVNGNFIAPLAAQLGIAWPELTYVASCFAGLFSITRGVARSIARAEYETALHGLLRYDVVQGAEGYALEKLWLAWFRGHQSVA